MSTFGKGRICVRQTSVIAETPMENRAWGINVAGEAPGLLPLVAKDSEKPTETYIPVSCFLPRVQRL